GTAGHGSQRNDDNPVTRLAAAISRIGSHPWPQESPLATRQLLEGVSELTGIEFRSETIGQLLAELGSVEKFVAPTLQNTSNPSCLDAGYKHNVIPGTATPYVYCRARTKTSCSNSRSSPARASTSKPRTRARRSNHRSTRRWWHR